MTLKAKKKPSTDKKTKPMTRSLYCKLKTEHSARGTTPLLDENDIRLMAQKMPQTPETLMAVLGCEAKMKAHSGWILPITKTHERDQDRFNDCAGEIAAFARGGGFAWQQLQRVFQSIIKTYDLELDKASVLDACGLYYQPFEGVIKRKRENDSDAPPAKRVALS